MTIALLRPPGTTDAGTLVQEEVWLVDVTLTPVSYTHLTLPTKA